MAQEKDLVEGLRKHALAHYTECGWDFLVECWEDKYILEVIQGAKTLAQAITKARVACMLLDEQRRAVENEIF